MAAQQYDLDDHFPPLASLEHGNHAHKRNDNDDNDNNYNLGSRIDDLNDTLLELIFTRLVQWRHLVTCKCVSKRWNSIISNPYFYKFITNKYSAFTLCLGDRWSKDDCLITEHPYFQSRKLRLNDIILNHDRSRVFVVAYHNDILVLRHRRYDEELIYYIANPLTKQFIVIPVTYEELQACKVGFAGVVDGISTVNSKNNVMGFRIIRVMTAHPYILVWQLYSSETGKWTRYRVNNSGFELRKHDKLDQAVTVNNRVHYRGLFNKVLVIDPFVDDIISHCVLNLPREIEEDSVLCSCRNRLRIAQLESDQVAPRLKVWEFEDGADSISWGSNKTVAKLRLVIDYALKPIITDRGFPLIECLFSIYKRRKNEVICCQPNDPDIVYLIFNHKLVEYDVVNSRFVLGPPRFGPDLCLCIH